MLTKIDYMYRDASNFKFRGTFFVCGHLRFKVLADFLFDNEFFVPQEVGLNHLLRMPMNRDDHYLHTFEKFETAKHGEAICSADELISRFYQSHTKGWFHSFDRFPNG